MLGDYVDACDDDDDEHDADAGGGCGGGGGEIYQDKNFSPRLQSKSS